MWMIIFGTMISMGLDNLENIISSLPRENSDKIFHIGGVEKEPGIQIRAKFLTLCGSTYGVDILYVHIVTTGMKKWKVLSTSQYKGMLIWEINLSHKFHIMKPDT